MAYEWLVFMILWIVTKAADIELLDCAPPDVPRWGGYGPRQDFYLPGDAVHYYCDVDTFISGNFYRKCEDTGTWSGDAPVCDGYAKFSSTSQSSTADEMGGSERAVDGIRTTCSSTKGGGKQEWSGTFEKPGQFIRVMVFFPVGHVSYEVVLVKANGGEIVCGTYTLNLDRYEWTILETVHKHAWTCPDPHNNGAVGLKIRSLTAEPLQICELYAHVLPSPKCSDPHVQIESGRLRLSRYSATLICDSGYERSRDTTLQCIREGVWNRKTLYCSERKWDLNEKEPDSNGEGERPDSDQKRPGFEPRQRNPKRERERL